LTERREEFGITAIEAVEETATGASFLLCDLDRNWWEIAAPCSSGVSSNPNQSHLTGEPK
jgi:hypothetical protein